MRSVFRVIPFGVFILLAATLLSLRQADSPADKVKQQLILQSDSLLQTVRSLQATKPEIAQTRLWQQRFKQARLAYKRLEWAAEYFDPITARLLNGPPVPETEPGGMLIEPEGLQMIEQNLFPRFVATKKQELKELLDLLITSATLLRSSFEKSALQDWQIIDAAKQEVFRVETLGLNRYDSPLAGNCFAESAAALKSTQAAMANYTPAGNDKLGSNFQQAIRYLLHPVSFNDFDRAAFITRYANPLSRAITELRKQMDVPDIRYNRLLNQDAATLFDRNAFNRNAYTDKPADSATAEKIALGKKLFFDPVLSGTMTRSCATCHQPEKAFTDGLPKNTDLTGKKLISRNTPTLINAALQSAQFYDLRATSLEDQAMDVVRNEDEMHGDMQLSTQKLWQDSTYRRLFALAFPAENRQQIDTLEVMNALASFVRSLTALNSRFDNYMQGNPAALKPAELKGFNLFMGKARCATCHYLPLFNGTLPPRYMQMDAEILGVPQTTKGKRIDPDPGVFAMIPEPFNHYAFKTTTVRNVTKTAPYMHNGVFNTLEEVVDFYEKGGGAGMGIKTDNQTLDAEPLNLTALEKKELVAFMKSLDSR